MAGLVLKLAPNERVLINGVVMENGDRKTTLRIKTPNASILRLRDALHPDDVKTPVTRAYYAAQLVVAGSAEPEPSAATLADQLDALGDVFARLPESLAIDEARQNLRARNFYAVMRTLHPLIDVERALLGHAAAASEPRAPAAAAAH